MSQIISLSLCLSDIDKSKITTGKNGKLYYAISVGTKDEKDQYGKDASAWESQTKEERTANKERKWLGNGEIVWDSVNGSRVATVEETDDLPF